MTVPDLDLSASFHPGVFSQHLLWPVSYQSPQCLKDVRVRLMTLAPSPSVHRPHQPLCSSPRGFYVLRPQGLLQVLFPPSGHLFFGTSSGEHFLLLELISVGSLQEEVPDPLDKVKASYSMLSLSSMDVSPLHTSRLTLTHSLCDSLAHMDSPRPADG